MRYKLLALFVALLIATPIYAQENSYLIVKTLKPTPTIIKSHELFIQEYKISFLDLSNEDKEVFIKEEDLSFENLGLFKVVKLDIKKTTVEKEFLQHDWYLTYTLSVIDNKKGVLKIPSITIPWTVKKIGDTISKDFTGWNTNIKTKEVLVNYATTVIPDDPQITLRDEFDLGDFSLRANIFAIIGVFLAVAPAGIWIWRFRKYRRRPLSSEKESVNKENADEYVGKTFEPVSRKEALGDLRYSIKRLEKYDFDKPDHEISDMMTELVFAITQFLRVEVNEFNPGTTQTEMVKILDQLKNQGKKTQALKTLAKKALFYESFMEQNEVFDSWPLSVNDDLAQLKGSVAQLSWRAWLFK